MVAPWQNPPDAGGFKLKGYVGTLGLFIYGGYHAWTPAPFERPGGVLMTQVVLDGPEAGTVNAKFINRNVRIMSKMRKLEAGGVVLGRIVTSPVGGNDAYDLADPTPADEQIATGWHQYFPTKLTELSTDLVQSYQHDEASYQAQLYAESHAPPTPPAQQQQRAPQPAQQQWVKPAPAPQWAPQPQQQWAPQPAQAQAPLPFEPLPPQAPPWGQPAAAPPPPPPPNGGQVAPSAPPAWGQNQFPPAPPAPPAPPQPVSTSPWATTQDQPPY
jgi:hypothetical protein